MKDWSNWPEMYYQSTDREERRTYLKERLESGEADEKDRLRLEFWDLRYKQREKMPEGVDYFIRAWMELYFISRKPDSRWQKKQYKERLKEAKKDFGFELAASHGSLGEEILYQELCHGIAFYIGLCKTDSKYNSQLLGILKLKPDELAEKIGNELWKISTVVPQVLNEEENFTVLKRACRDTFWKIFPKYVKDDEIKLER